jgi:hypothetical protein
MESYPPREFGAAAMRFLSVAIVFLLVLGSATPVTGAAAAPRMNHSRITCVPADGNARIAVNVTSSSPIISARVYFRSAVKSSGDYYLELKKGDGGNYWAVLPIPLSETTSVNYRILVKDADGQETGTETFSVPTTSSCAATLSGDETRYANNLIIGLTSDSQSAVPEGFKCKGVVGKITVAGDLRPNDECRMGGAVAAIPTAAWIAGGLAVAAGTGAVVANNVDCKCPPVSSARPEGAAVTSPNR